jgi:glutamate racemase
MKIGIFDSGMGGLTVLAEAQKRFPDLDFIYYGDSAHAPYGIKTKEEVLERSKKVCDFLINKHVEAIVVACNTATSAAIKQLRAMYKIPIIGMEPALKPAISHHSGGRILVMATPMTLNEEKFQNLLQTHKKSEIIYELPTPTLVNLIEEGYTKGQVIENALKMYFQNINLMEIDSVVLGCTHFLFVKESIKSFFNNNVEIVDGHLGTLMQLSRKIKLPIEKKNIKYSGHTQIYNSLGQEAIEKSLRLLALYEVDNGN